MPELRMPYEYSKEEEAISFFIEPAIMKSRWIPTSNEYALGPIWSGITQMSAIQTARPLSEEIANTFKDLVSKIDGVSEAYLKAEGDSMNLWTVIDRDDTALMRKVYRAELELADRFPDLEFDFRVIPKDIFFPPQAFTQIL